MDLNIQVLKNRQETEARLWERNEWVERVGVVMSSRLFVTSSPLPNSERCLIVDVINCPIGPHNPLQFPGLVGSLNQWASRDLRQLFALQRSKEPVRTVSIEDAANPIKMIQLKFHICHCDKQSDLIWFLSQLSCQTLHIACHHNENSLEMKWHFHMGNLFWFPNSSKFWKSDVVFFVLDTINRNRWAKFIWFQVLRKFSLTCAINLQRHALCGFPIVTDNWTTLSTTPFSSQSLNHAFFQCCIFPITNFQEWAGTSFQWGKWMWGNVEKNLSCEPEMDRHFFSDQINFLSRTLKNWRSLKLLHSYFALLRKSWATLNNMGLKLGPNWQFKIWAIFLNPSVWASAHLIWHCGLDVGILWKLSDLTMLWMGPRHAVWTPCQWIGILSGTHLKITHVLIVRHFPPVVKQSFRTKLLSWAYCCSETLNSRVLSVKYLRRLDFFPNRLLPRVVYMR